MKNKEFYNHKDVMEILNRSKDFAYKTIRKLNKELEEKLINQLKKNYGIIKERLK